MRWRLIALAVLAAASLVLVIAFAQQALALQAKAQDVYESFDGQNPSQADQDRGQRLSLQSYSLQLAIPPLGTSVVVCVAGILVVLARRWQLDNASGVGSVRARAPSR